MALKWPVVDIGRCTLCLGCTEIAPEVFQYNSELDYIEVVDLSQYPEELVDDAIVLCPVDCIEWSDEEWEAGQSAKA